MAFIPFSAGPGICPGRNLVMLLGSHVLATLLGAAELELEQPERLAGPELPGVLNNFSLAFRFTG